jgi:1-phosphofructokinase
MFFTMTLNPALDRTLTVDRLEIGGIQSVRAEMCTPGGKGVNVAKMLAANGKAVTAAGLLGQDDLPLYEAFLAPLGITCRFLHVHHATRTNLMVTDGQGREMKLNRPGFPDLEFDQATLTAYATTLCGPDRIIILSGSLPARFPSDTYALLTRLFHAAGCRVVLDASGPALTEGLKEKPDVIKPNRQELEAELGLSLESDDRMRRALQDLMTRHEAVIVSDGPRGAWFASAGRLLFAPSPFVPKIDTTGAGDTLLGQFCADYFPARKLTPELAARAVAAGAAAVEQQGTPPIALTRVRELADPASVIRF